jgi:Tat protein secretion system quality control protein TatD with DNase activity
MIIDCHYHLERRLLTDNELLRKMDECEVDKVALMGVINEPIPKATRIFIKYFSFFMVTHSISLYRKIPF